MRRITKKVVETGVKAEGVVWMVGAGSINDPADKSGRPSDESPGPRVGAGSMNDPADKSRRPSDERPGPQVGGQGDGEMGRRANHEARPATPEHGTSVTGVIAGRAPGPGGSVMIGWRRFGSAP